MIDLYTWGTPNGRKVSIALEEMGLEYNVHPIAIGKDEQFAPDFLKISPNNKIPAIVDNDNGQSVFESGAILIYLAEKTGQFMPTDPPGRVAVMEWLMWQMGGFGPMLGQTHHFHKFNPSVAPYAEDRFLNESKRLYGVLDKRLGETAYVGGDALSIADFTIWPWAARAEWQSVTFDDLPNVGRWYRELAARPGFQAGYEVPPNGQSIPVL
jgi:GST-like protein